MCKEALEITGEDSMTTAIDFLTAQMDSDEVWKKASKRVGECLQLERRVKAGVDLFNLFNGFDGLWSMRVQDGAEKFDAQIVAALHRIYTWWMTPCDEVMTAIQAFEREGYEVVGAAQLRAACTTVRGILRTNVEELTKAMQAIRDAA